MDITDICFEHIKTVNDVQYHKALYGSFVVIMMKTDDYMNGYTNATKLCTDGGKIFKKWHRLDGSKGLITCLEQNLGGPDLAPPDLCVKIDFHGNNEEDRLISGTYIHPKLIAHVGIWISPEFGLKVSDVVNRYFIEYFNTELRNDKNKLEQQIKEYESVVADKNNVITSLENSNKELDSTNKHQNQSIN